MSDKDDHIHNSMNKQIADEDVAGILRDTGTVLKANVDEYIRKRRQETLLKEQKFWISSGLMGSVIVKIDKMIEKGDSVIDLSGLGYYAVQTEDMLRFMGFDQFEVVRYDPSNVQEMASIVMFDLNPGFVERLVCAQSVEELETQRAAKKRRR